MELLLEAIKHDWFIILPILVCSIMVVAVVINRFSFYNENKRDVVQFIHRLQRELQRNNLEGAQNLSAQLGGIIGEVAEEGIRVLFEQPKDFARSFDITINLAARKLEKHLTILGTIGAVAPFLGLFGTVVRILYTFSGFGSARKSKLRSCDWYRFSVNCYGFWSWGCYCCGYLLQYVPSYR
ncbi:MAG: MotA/TolQ/ExbB proton channel family protein [Desulfosudis oleivorans]|nr:MotA/TolQ/ExbB proton channel family protein [Desulfosudis oleivorans]